MAERLQKILSRAGFGSRRTCEKIIADGRVSLNGRLARLGDKADPPKDKISVDGQPVKIKHTSLVYLALNKPKGVLSSLEDETGEARKTVRDLIPLPGHLYPVGRLDKQSTGLILMTNDGSLAHKLTHPRYGHSKMYHVTVTGRIPGPVIQKWQDGVWLDDRKTIPAKIKIINQGQQFTQLEIVMREGRKRQIRRIANMLGYPVQQLVRERIGPVVLGNLRPGEWRHLTNAEISDLRKIARAEVKRPRKNRSAYKKSGKPARGKSKNTNRSRKL